MNNLTHPPFKPHPHNIHAEFQRGMKHAVPVMLGFIPFALLLGAQAVSKGFSLLEVPLMTGSNFGGGSEFTAVNLWTTPPDMFVIVLMSILVNSRHILMGATLAPLLSHLPKRKVLPCLFFMCDESWAMSLSDAQKNQYFSLDYYLGISVCLYFTWVIFTTLGAVLSPYIGQLKQFGFDMAFTAVFLVLLKGMWKSVSINTPWFVSLIVAGLTYLYLPNSWYVLSGALSGLVFSYFYGETQ